MGNHRMAHCQTWVWKDAQFNIYTIVTKIIRKFKRWLVIVKIIKHSCK